MTAEPLDLVAIKARCDAATAGPWVAGDPLGWEGARVTGPEMIIYDEGGHSDADAAFIAHARTDVPALVAEVKRVLDESYEAVGSLIAQLDQWKERAEVAKAAYRVQTAEVERLRRQLAAVAAAANYRVDL